LAAKGIPAKQAQRSPTALHALHEGSAQWPTSTGNDRGRAHAPGARDGQRLPPAATVTPLTDAALRAALTELKAIVDLIERYEERCPLGKDPNVPGGKGLADLP
jgi:hypothetical protein